MTEQLTISLRGLSASGKGTIAPILAKELNVQHIDCGLLFRAIALYICEHQITSKHLFLEKVRIRMICETVFIVEEKTYPREQLQTEKVGYLAAELAKSHSEQLVSLVNELLSSMSRVVVDGRNAGLNILPNPDFSFFLQASLKSRIQRRYEQERFINKEIKKSEIKSSLIKRDTVDQKRDRKLTEPQLNEHIIVTDGKTPLQCAREIVSVVRIKTKMLAWTAVDKHGDFFTYEDGTVVVVRNKSQIPIRVRESEEYSVVKIELKFA